jgi:hypothetical protein
MIEAYAFYAVFSVQILAMSVVYPAWFIRHVRAQVMSFPAERFAEMFPGVDRTQLVESFATRYRAVNTCIAVIGLFLLGALFSYMRSPDWDDGPVETVLALYFVAQALPLGFVASIAVRYSKVFRRSLLASKRKAVLERRGLFDFVSPSIVILAVLAYFLFVAFVIYIAQHPFPGFAGYPINIGLITLLYAFIGFCVYMQMYGRKSNPLQSHADRMHTIGVSVKIGACTCIASVVFLALNFTLVLLDLQRWEPFAQSIFFVVCALFLLRSLNVSPRQPDANDLGSSPAP